MIPCHLQIVTALLLPLWFGFLLFLFLFWLLWLELPKLYWIKVARVDILIWFLILEEMLSCFSSSSMIFSCGFVIYGLYYVEVCSLYVLFYREFFLNHKWMLSFIRSFSASIEMIICFFSICLYGIYHTDWFIDIEKSLHPWDKFYLNIVYVNPT